MKLLKSLLEQQDKNFHIKVMMLLGVDALSQQDSDFIYRGMENGMTPDEVAGQLQAAPDKLPPELDTDPEAMPVAGGPSL